MRSAFITGLAGLELTTVEAALLKAGCPAGIIRFQRNVADPAQVGRLIAAARAAVAAEDFLVLIDQEGGRVQRLRPPYWRQMPAAASYGAAYASDPAGAQHAARLAAGLVAMELSALCLYTRCGPVLYVSVRGSHGIHRD